MTFFQNAKKGIKIWVWSKCDLKVPFFRYVYLTRNIQVLWQFQTFPIEISKLVVEQFLAIKNR